MPKVNVSTQAYEWLRRKVAKQAKAYQALPENEARKEERVIKHWSDLNKKINYTQPPLGSNMMLELALKRVELRTLQTMTLETMVTIQSKLIPQYQDRMTRIPEKKEFYQEYLNKAGALYQGLSELLNEINKAVAQ